jgi:hypothetical protein
VTVLVVIAVVALVAAGALIALRRGRAPLARGPRRILFPVVGTALSKPALDAALRIARAERATLVVAYLAPVPLHLPLDAALPLECDLAIPLLEAVEQRGTAAGVPVVTRIERGRTYRHALRELVEHERYDRIVVAASPDGAAGFTADDIGWLLRSAPGEIVVVRPSEEAPARPANGVPVAA